MIRSRNKELSRMSYSLVRSTRVTIKPREKVSVSKLLCWAPRTLSRLYRETCMRTTNALAQILWQLIVENNVSVSGILSCRENMCSCRPLSCCTCKDRCNSLHVGVFCLGNLLGAATVGAYNDHREWACPTYLVF